MLAGICLYSQYDVGGATREPLADMEELLQLLDGLNQRCTVLQHDLQSYTDAIVQRLVMFSLQAMQLDVCDY